MNRGRVWVEADSQEGGDVEMAEDTAGFEVFHLALKLGARAGLHHFLKRRGQLVEKGDDFRRQELHEQRVVGVDRKKHFGGLPVFHAHLVELRELLDFVGGIVHVVAADFAEVDFPLAEKGLRLGIVRGDDGVVERVDAGNGDGVAAFRAEVACEVFRRERLARLAKVKQRPKETLGRMAVDFNRLLHLPFLVAKADKDEVVAVQPDAEKRIKRLTMLRPHVVRPLLDLLDDPFAAGRIGLRPDAVGGAAFVQRC
jgi:hypothetical protein